MLSLMLCYENTKEYIYHFHNEYLYMTAFHNRPSIYLRVVESTDGNFEQELQWIVDSIRKEGSAAPKTIIYVRLVVSPTTKMVTVHEHHGVFLFCSD